MADAISSDRWRSLVGRIDEGRVTPLIGAGASAGTGILSGADEMSREWAVSCGYPDNDVWNLSKVAQYVACYNPGDDAAPGEYVSRLLTGALDGTTIADVDDCRFDPHWYLPKLNIPVYVTTNYDDLIVRGLMARNRRPLVRACTWRPPNRYWKPAEDELPDDFVPTAAEPLVFHLHGRYDDPQSMVISEADYLAFLEQISRGGILPPVVADALANNALIVMGYSFTDVNVQLLLRSWRSPRRGVAVRPSPDLPEDRRTRFEDFFSEYVESLTEKKLDMFWGTAAEFCERLDQEISGGRTEQP